MQADVRAAGSSEMRPVREWGLDPMCFTHVRLLAFDLLSLRPVPNLQGSYARKGRPVRKVEIMGVVVTEDQKERYTRFTLDDGTGCVSCILWTNHSSFAATSAAKGLELQVRQELATRTTKQVKLGEVLRVQGRLSNYANQIQLTVLSLRADFVCCNRDGAGSKCRGTTLGGVYAACKMLLRLGGTFSKEATDLLVSLGDKCSKQEELRILYLVESFF